MQEVIKIAIFLRAAYDWAKKNPSKAMVTAFLIYKFIKHQVKQEKVDAVWKPFLDDDIKAKIEKEIITFLDKINKFAWQKIDTRNINKRWISEQMLREQDNALWKNLSSDKTSQKYFKTSPMDPTEGIFFIKTSFLLRQSGNPTGGMGKTKPIEDAIEKGIKLPTPQYWLSDKNLGEGNHRVAAMNKLGMKSVPVRVYWK